MNDLMSDDQSPQIVSQVRDNGIRFAVSFAFLLILILGIFYQTTFSMVSTWVRSETYTHGFLILPITIWLIWRKRKVLSCYPPEASYIALIPLSLAGVVWMLGNLVDVLVVQQLALVAMLVLSLWVVMGSRLCKMLMFPLAFLFFAVPMGEGLVPAMMEYTATITVTLVKLTGIPVYRDGLFISLPSGNWSVVEACSGVRYLISSITLGCLFAYINYASYKKRLIFILVSVIVPVVANGLRAYMIVMLGHLSGMTLAVGVDHLIYGWVFFGVVMLILFTIGSRWRDPEQDFVGTIDDSEIESDISLSGPLASKHLITSLAAAIIVILLWPACVFALNKFQHIETYNESRLPEVQGNWKIKEEKEWVWMPRIVGANREIHQFYTSSQNNMGSIGLHIAQYLEQKQGSEVVNSQNKLFNNQMSRWRITEKNKKLVKLNGHEIEVVSAIVKGPRDNLLVWYWYRVGAYHTTNNYIAKLREVKSKLIDSRRDAAIFSITTPIGLGDIVEKRAAASIHLQQFVNDMLPQYESALDHVVGKSGGD
jgi:exosortase A